MVPGSAFPISWRFIAGYKQNKEPRVFKRITKQTRRHLRTTHKILEQKRHLVQIWEQKNVQLHILKVEQIKVKQERQDKANI